MTQIGKISRNSTAYDARMRRSGLESGVKISSAGPASPEVQNEKKREQKKMLRLKKRQAASSLYLAQQIDQATASGTTALSRKNLLQRGTLAYIGADMLPELLAETKRPRRIDDKL